MSYRLSELAGPALLMWNHKLLTIAGIKISFGNLLVALVLLLFATRLSRMVSRFIDRRLIQPFVPDKGTQTTYQTFAFYACLAGFVTLSLTIAGIPLSVFTVVGGALAIGVGFGSQNIVNNFISGVIILVEQPIKIGDIVELDGISGIIQSIGTRSTKIKNADNKIFVVPNSFFLEKSVLNWTYETSLMRSTLNFGVAFGSDVRLVENVCMDILLNTEGIRQTPLPLVLFENFSDSNLDFQLVFFCHLDEVSSLGEMKSKVRFAIERKFKEHNIQMAFPQRDMHLKLDKSLDVRVIS
ncbi:MAG TPA: mechanosensitive ion channel domain-containing protein [Bacteriovoracaceae bacterium]|nr:mechanosensitive ion channel domain-containing protein [Bacteriovoracaceae bacterium]